MNEDRAADYAYPYGRVSGMHSKLLPERDIISFMQAVDAEEIIASLEGTGYGVQLEGMPEGFVLGDVERALEENYVQTYLEVTSTIPPEDKLILDDYFLGGFDLEDVKTILRGVLKSISPEKILELTCGWGRLGREKIVELSRTQNLRDFISRLNEPYRGAMESGLLEYQQKGDPGFLEFQLDSTYLKSLGGLDEIGDYIRLRVECLNLVNLLRCGLAGAPPKKYMIDAGLHLSNKKIAGMAAMEPEDILNTLSKTFYSKAVADLTGDSEMLWKLEKNLSQLQLNTLKEKTIANPLSLWSVIYYMESKRREVDKIRSIVVLKYGGFTPEEIGGVLT